MEIYDKINLLESKIDKLLADAAEARDAKASLQREYDELLEKFIVAEDGLKRAEDELRRVNEDKDAVRQRIENIIARFD